MERGNELLRRFAEEKSHEAFAELVREKVGLVFAAALRQTGGDAHLAEDVTQRVFVELASAAARLQHHAVLSGWLFTTTRHLAINAVRKQRRWQRREREASSVTTLTTDESPAWRELRPVIDEALHELADKDRDALVLRFFEGRSLAEVGAVVGLAENSARMRVDRALEKLRSRLARRGITSTAAALGSTLVAQPLITVPAGVTAQITAAALSGAAATTAGALAAGQIFSAPKIAAGVAVLLGGFAWYDSAAARIDAEFAGEFQRQEIALAGLRVSPAGRPAATSNPTDVTTGRDVLPPVPVDPLERLRAVSILLREGAVGRVRWMFGAAFPEILTPATRSLFALTRDETDALNAQLERAMQEIGSMALAQTTVERRGREIVLRVPEIPGARGSFERLRESFRRTLGAERFALMEEIGLIKALEAGLGEFGLTPSVIYLWNVSHPRLPEFPYALERVQPAKQPLAAELWPGADEHPGSMDFAALQQNLGPFGGLVPADF